MLNITSSAIYLSKRAISRANPGRSKIELDLLFVKYHYGGQLSEKAKKVFTGKIA